MSKGEIVIVFDCGATNVRVIAINRKGVILACESFTNNTKPDPFYPSYRIWNVNEIWNKMCLASKQILKRIDAGEIAGVTVTTFGVDGTFFDRSGNMLHPVISWQCERTNPIMSDIGRYIAEDLLYNESGVYPFSFNTINKLIWFSENKPEIIDKHPLFLFMPSVFSFFLTGEMYNDITMAGTSMLTSLENRTFSENILKKLNLSADIFGKTVEAGSITGTINTISAYQTGIPVNTPVIATGHDTQFAIFGSGAEKNQPVLSSGTWEVLMVRSEGFRSDAEQMKSGITTEFDSRPGLYNIGNQWIASGVLEWIRKNFFNDKTDNVYDFMISEAEKVPSGCNGVKVVPSFNDLKEGGSILGLKMDTSRHEIYRSALEALSEKLARGKTALETAGRFKAESILCVGGGSKNRLWNQLRANAAGVPLKIIDQKETTVLGASLFVQAACGNASSPEDARKEIDYKTEVIEPRGI